MPKQLLKARVFLPCPLQRKALEKRLSEANVSFEYRKLDKYRGIIYRKQSVKKDRVIDD